MSSPADVRSIQTLEDLQTALSRFAGGARESLTAAELEIRRTLDWLDERTIHWQNEVQLRQEAVDLAQTALGRCEASGSYDREGRYQPPNCSAYEHALREAHLRLRNAQDDLHNVESQKRTVQQAAADYRRQAQQFVTLLDNDLPQASAFLADKIDSLEAYISVEVTPGGGSSVESTVLSTAPPTQVMATMLTESMQLSTLNPDVTGVFIGLVNQMANNPRELQGDIGEQLAQHLSEQFGLIPLPFDQPKHGFDSVLTAPGLPLIVLEAKTTRDGAFHPGQTHHGIQGSPEWIATQANKMNNPESMQWSPANERIAALVHELGPENVPAVAVVIQSETGSARVYFRAVGQEDWQLLPENASLVDMLKGA